MRGVRGITLNHSLFTFCAYNVGQTNTYTDLADNHSVISATSAMGHSALCGVSQFRVVPRQRVLHTLFCYSSRSVMNLAKPSSS